MAQFQTTDYPASTSIAVWNDGSNYLRINITGASGRRFGVQAGAVVDTDAFYDNVVLLGTSGFSGTPTIYLANGTLGSDEISSEAASGDAVLALGGGAGWSGQIGAFDLVVLIETGTATDTYEPLATSGLAYTVEVEGSPGFDEVADDPPVGNTCFWTDRTRVFEDCSNDAPDPGAPGDLLQNIDWPDRTAVPEVSVSATRFIRLQISGGSGRNLRMRDITIDSEVSESPFFRILEQVSTNTFDFGGNGTFPEEFFELTEDDVYLDFGNYEDYDGAMVKFEMTLDIETGVGTGEYVPLFDSGLYVSYSQGAEPQFAVVYPYTG